MITKFFFHVYRSFCSTSVCLSGDSKNKREPRPNSEKGQLLTSTTNQKIVHEDNWSRHLLFREQCAKSSEICIYKRCSFEEKIGTWFKLVFLYICREKNLSQIETVLNLVLLLTNFPWSWSHDWSKKQSIHNLRKYWIRNNA